MMAAPTPDDQQNALNAALQLAALGLRVVPIAPGRKHPALPAWNDAATDDADVVTSWWTGLYRGHGVGIALGPQPNGHNLFAVDIDGERGKQNMHQVLLEHGELPTSWRSDTGGDGAHLIFAAPADLDIRNQQATGNRIAPGVDVRGNGGQIVVAPTLHPQTGRRYEWRTGRAPWQIDVAEAPRWLLELVAPIERPTPPTEQTTRIDYAAPMPERQDDDTPADWLRRRWNWHAELEAAGWTVAATKPNGDTWWTRPGKATRDGHSGVLHGTDGPFVVFTTETTPALAGLGTPTTDGSGRSYSPLEWHAAHRHHGNVSDASRALRTDMVASERPSTTVPPGIDPVTGEILKITEPQPDDNVPLGIEFVGFNHQFPEPRPLIDGLLDLGTVGVLYARWGCFKSFLAIDWGLHVACGIDWYGRTVEPGPVAILAYEAPLSIHRRVHAWAKHHQQTPSDRDYLLATGRLPRLTSHPLMMQVSQQLDQAGVRLVIVDTIARGGVGADMNTNEADEVFAGLHLLGGPDRVVLGIGHAGKDASRGLRGFSAQEDQVDFLFRLDRERDSNTQQPRGPATLTAPKAKDREPPGRMTFDLVTSERIAPDERVLLRRDTDEAVRSDEPVDQPIDIAIRLVRSMLAASGDQWVPTKSVVESCKRPRQHVGRGDVREAITELLEEQYIEIATTAGGECVRMTGDSRHLEGN